MNIFDFLKEFFQGVTKDHNTIPFLHEAIDLKHFPTNEVDLWEAKGGYSAISNKIIEAFQHFYITGKVESGPKVVTIVEDAYKYGWHLACNQLEIDNQSYSFYAYALSKRLKKSDYVIQVAEQKSISKNGAVEMIIHYYLKPSIRLRIPDVNKKVSQLYGNITIEYKSLNGEPHAFKFLAKAYSDSKYAEPLAFSDLHAMLFDR